MMCSRPRRHQASVAEAARPARRWPVRAAGTVSDGNAGLRRAVERVWPHAAVQRCCVHKLRNLERKAPKHALAEIRDDFHRIVLRRECRRRPCCLRGLRAHVGQTLPGRGAEPRRGRATSCLSSLPSPRRGGKHCERRTRLRGSTRNFAAA